jgi:DNA replication protein
MSFTGFPPGKTRLTPVPAQFFNELLPQIDHLGELKLTLYVFWRLDRMEQPVRYLRHRDFAQDERFMQGLGEDAEKALDEALTRSVQRGTLLLAKVQLGEQAEKFYFLNSPRGRAAHQAAQRGEWRPPSDEQIPVELAPEAPNIFRLYEENIGPLTPLIAEALAEAEDTYSANWIEEAFQIAVERNARNWRYVEAILNRWYDEGRDDQKDGRDTEKDRRRYAEWGSSSGR